MVLPAIRFRSILHVLFFGAVLALGCGGEKAATQEDLQILDRAGALLANENNWNRHDTRDCPANETKLSLFCALKAASIEVLGEYDHRRLALEEVRFAIEEVSGGREFEHRLMDFNNLPETRLADIHKVLALARERVAEKLQKQGTH
jgi:hypothetical protein